MSVGKIYYDSMKANWVIKSMTDEQKQTAINLAEELTVSLELAQLLVIRDITTFDEAKDFFRSSLDNLHDPFLMKDMQVAVDRINRALRKKERILIYGDYDVDGTTAVALVYSFLKQYTNKIRYYIPDRNTEGYGISDKSIEYAKKEKFSLVIALDCGIKANDKIDKANKYGIDFVICDHHTPGDEIPKALAVLDAYRTDCNYPYRHLSGCGVGFKLIQALCISNNIDLYSAFKFIDLVAVSIASDIVPITGENRILASWGLQKLNKKPSAGLKAIKKLCGLDDKKTDISDVVFKIGPRINASGRLYLGQEAVQLLTSRNADVLAKKSEEIDNYNSERKEMDRETTEQAKQQFREVENYQDKKGIVLYSPEWNKGIIGIVASRVAEEFCRPTIILANSDNGLITGSGRSVVGFDLYSAIDACSDLLVNFGGHPYAAGLTFRKENMAVFIERFEQYVSAHISPEQLVPQLKIDIEIDFDKISDKFIRVLKQFAPFGPKNLKPVFCTKNLSDFNNQTRLIGKDKTHAKLVLSQDGKTFFNGVAFRSNYMRDYDMSDIVRHLKVGNKIDVCYTIEENFYNGTTTNQLMIKDIRLVS